MEKNLNWGVALCCVTGELIQDGFYLQCADRYFKHEDDLVSYLRTLGDDSEGEDDRATILARWYAQDDMEHEGYYYSSWHPESANYIEIDGDVYEIEMKHRIKRYI
jgi:hypothetical protein